MPFTEFIRLTLLKANGRILVEGRVRGLDPGDPGLKVLKATLHFVIVQDGAIAAGDATVDAPGTEFDWDGIATPITGQFTPADTLAHGLAILVKGGPSAAFETLIWSRIKTIEQQTLSKP
jgi:hypothetical protein